MFRSFSDKKSPRKSFRLKPPFTRHAISIMICAACMLCATLASFLYQHIVPDNHANVALFYILALVIIARWTVGYGYGIACTLFSVIAINYLFTYPYYTLNFTLTGYPITFLLMSGITLILCTMTSHMTIQSEMIAEREKRLAEAEMEKMEQVTINLLENAIVHSGSILPIDFIVEDHPEHVSFIVRDYGKGLSEEKLQNLFETGTYNNSQSSDSRKGMGIGLSICKTIITAHHGTLSGRNHADGAEFCFTLPKVGAVASEK